MLFRSLLQPTRKFMLLYAITLKIVILKINVLVFNILYLPDGSQVVVRIIRLCQFILSSLPTPVIVPTTLRFHFVQSRPQPFLTLIKHHHPFINPFTQFLLFFNGEIESSLAGFTATAIIFFCTVSTLYK